jgi:hypothetical protein
MKNAYRFFAGQHKAQYYLGDLRPDGMVKGKNLTKHHAMKAYWGSGGIAPRIL